MRRSSAVCAGGMRCPYRREVTFTDLHGTIVEHNHVDVRAWLWVTGASITRIPRELEVNRKTAERLFRLAYFTLRFRLLPAGHVARFKYNRRHESNGQTCLSVHADGRWCGKGG